MLDTLYDRYQIKVANESTTYLPLVFAVGRQKSTAPTSTAVVSNRPDRGRLFGRIRPWFFLREIDRKDAENVQLGR